MQCRHRDETSSGAQERVWLRAPMGNVSFLRLQNVINAGNKRGDSLALRLGCAPPGEHSLRAAGSAEWGPVGWDNPVPCLHPLAVMMRRVAWWAGSPQTAPIPSNINEIPLCFPPGSTLAPGNTGGAIPKGPCVPQSVSKHPPSPWCRELKGRTHGQDQVHGRHQLALAVLQGKDCHVLVCDSSRL